VSLVDWVTTNLDGGTDDDFLSGSPKVTSLSIDKEVEEETNY